MKVPYVGDDEIFHCASRFLENYYPSLELPVPIEIIAESKLGIMILPISGLEIYCEVAGTLSKDFKTILIDERTYDKQQDRARFTIAHEVGHLILHKELFQKTNGTYTVDDFISFQNNLDPKDYKKLEIQAFRFAEEILCPRQLFSTLINEAIIERGGIDLLVVSDLEKIITFLSIKFQVSSKAIFNKMRRDFPGLIENISSNMPF